MGTRLNIFLRSFLVRSILLGAFAIPLGWQTYQEWSQGDLISVLVATRKIGSNKLISKENSEIVMRPVLQARRGLSTLPTGIRAN